MHTLVSVLWHSPCFQRIPFSFKNIFEPGESTTFQLLHTYHMFCEAVDTELYFVISAKLLIDSGIRDYFISYVE